MSVKVIITALIAILPLAINNLQAQECHTNKAQEQKNGAEKKATLDQLADMDFEDLMEIAIVSSKTSEVTSRGLTIISESEIMRSSAKNLLQLINEVSETNCEGSSNAESVQASECSQYILDGKKMDNSNPNNQEQALKAIPIENIEQIEIKKEVCGNENKTIRVVRIITKSETMTL